MKTMISVWMARGGGLPTDVRAEIAGPLPRPGMRNAVLAFISAKLAFVLAAIAIGGGLLAMEWHRADSAKTHHATAHHHHHHGGHGAAAN